MKGSEYLHDKVDSQHTVIQPSNVKRHINHQFTLVFLLVTWDNQTTVDTGTGEDLSIHDS